MPQTAILHVGWIAKFLDTKGNLIVLCNMLTTQDDKTQSLTGCWRMVSPQDPAGRYQPAAVTQRRFQNLNLSKFQDQFFIT